jgi:phosphoribosylaminoimidazolecarboxamide formyltransferase/IMP cyclohydrolase
MKKIERALISVSDKTGIVELAYQLRRRGVEILSTGGTAALLARENIAVTPIEAFTGFPEMLDGRVKTLHPKVHAGLLARRDNPEHHAVMQAHGLAYIDVVIVNLYPFETTISRPNATFEEAIENIDIGGPTMLRAAAKNFRDVTVIVDPADYTPLLEELDAHDGCATPAFNQRLAQKVFAATAFYDALIAEYLADRTAATPRFPATHTIGYRKVQDLRYGENPHQQAAFYRAALQTEPCITIAKQLHGKELSYNNYLDADAALELVKEFAEPAVVIVKHTNPCGAAVAPTLTEAWQRALATDPVSAFGGIVSVNRPLDAATAGAIAELFLEAVIAPAFTPEALALLKGKKNLRLLQVDGLAAWPAEAPQTRQRLAVRSVVGGLLVQERDTRMITEADLRVVTRTAPTAAQQAALLFAWRCCKHVKSNAIVLARETELVGVGAGQMSRVDSVRLSIQKACKPVSGCVLASDAFFPFRDGVDAAAAAGITAIAQPGGSVKDDEVIAAADEHGIAMVFTGMRHFRH